MHSDVHGLQSPLFEYDYTKTHIPLQVEHGVPSGIAGGHLCVSSHCRTREPAGHPHKKKAHTTPADANKPVCVCLSPATDLVFHWEALYI
jgi:hypothetical protein